MLIRIPLAVVNFRIILPISINEDIGSVDVCIEQMNGELSKEIEVRVRTSQIGTTATGTMFIYVYQSIFAWNIHTVRYTFIFTNELFNSTYTASDYKPNTFTLTFSPGSRGPQSMCSYVEIFDDILVEEDETIEVTATFEQSEPEISLVRNTASTTITDNECKKCTCTCTYRIEVKNITFIV